MSLITDLDKMGINILKEKVYDDDKPGKKPQVEEAVENIDPLVEEKNAVFSKNYLCPVCGENFESLTVKTGKLHIKEYEIDLKPEYDIADALKYEVVACPHCGYAALNRYFSSISDYQIKEIRSQICQNYKKIEDVNKGYYTYDEAVKRFELAIANAIAAKVTVSEKAYLCLKTAWLIRSQREYLKTADPDKYRQTLYSSSMDERIMLKYALEGFTKAEQTEYFPIAGMNEPTLKYLIAALYVDTGDYDKALMVIGRVLVSSNMSSRIKDKMVYLRDIIREKQGKS